MGRTIATAAGEADPPHMGSWCLSRLTTKRTNDPLHDPAQSCAAGGGFALEYNGAGITVLSWAHRWARVCSVIFTRVWGEETLALVTVGSSENDLRCLGKGLAGFYQSCKSAQEPGTSVGGGAGPPGGGGGGRRRGGS